MEEEKPMEENTEEEIRPVNKFFGAPGSGKLPDQSPSVSNIVRIVVVLVILLSLGATFYLLRGKFQGSASKEQTPATIEITSPSPSPTPEFNRSQYIIRVLNGTKKTGLAASVSAKLKELGYKVDKTDNATSSAFTRTEVKVKEDRVKLQEYLIKDLMPDFDASVGAVLKSNDPVDAEIILGAK